MDLRPGLSSESCTLVDLCELDAVDFGEPGSWLDCIPAEGLRLKKGMPEGVLLGLSKLDLERPGDVVIRAGLAVTCAILAVPPLLMESVRGLLAELL